MSKPTMTPEVLAAIEARHQPCPGGTHKSSCHRCGQPWKCDARLLLDELNATVDRAVHLMDFMEARARREERARVAEAVKGLLPDVGYQIKTMDGRLRPMRTPADGWEAAIAAVLAAVKADDEQGGKP